MKLKYIFSVISFLLIIFYILFPFEEEVLAQNTTEKEIGVPDFPYDPEKRKETIIFCTKLCSKKKELCYKNVEYNETECEGIFVSCINMCR